MLIARSNKLIGFIFRTTKLFTNIRCIILLYTSLIRPILEYCCIIWSPSYSTNIERLEKIQKRFIRGLCYRCQIDYDSYTYEYLLDYFGLTLLFNRRRYYDVMFVFKVMNYLIKSPQILEMFFLNTPSYSLRQNELFHVEYHRTNYGKHSSLTRICSTANIIKTDIFNTNIKGFKNQLKRELIE